MNPYELQQLVTHGSQPQPVRFQGICTAVSTVTKQVGALLLLDSHKHIS